MSIEINKAPERDWLRLIGLVIGWVIVACLTRSLLRDVPQPWIFLDYANLIFHESGHVIFSLFGDVLRVFGGSLTQLLIPLICLVVFYLKQQFGSAAFCLFWLGDNLINVAVYIKDSQARALPLITGDPDSHDWHWLLDHFHILTHDQQIGGAVYFLGAVAMFGSLVWIGYLIWRTWSPPPPPQEGFTIDKVDPLPDQEGSPAGPSSPTAN